MPTIDPTIRYMHKFQTTSEFEAAYYGEDYHTPWVSAVVETQKPAYNKLEITAITLVNLAWAIDVPASGGTANKDNCTYTVIGYTPDGKTSIITALATVTGSASVESSISEERHSAGTLTLTATYSALTDSDSVTIYQAAFVPAVTAITLDDLTWVTNIPSSGGTATSANCTFSVTAYYDNSTTGDVTTEATISGSLEVDSSATPTMHTAGTLTLTASLCGLTATDSVTVYQEGASTDYSTQYLTLNVINGGTINWKTVGNVPRTISYSLDNGNTWTEITSTSTGTPITVETGDKVLIKGTNASYATTKENYSAFEDGTASYNVEGNIMSLIYGDNFIGNTAMTGSYNFCSLFKLSNVVSAENLVLPATVLTPHCYRAMFANSPSVEVAPELPALVLADSCYKYMFQETSITTAPDLLVPTLVVSCYEGMFNRCANLNHIKCLATDLTPASATTAWTQNVANTGIFIKKADIDWERGNNGIPTKWTVSEVGTRKPNITCDGLYITLTPQTQGADTYYRLNQTGTYTQYSSPVSISADTIVEAYSVYSGDTSVTASASCIYDDGIEEPVIYCDGEYVSISCDTGGATVYYKLDHAVAYSEYTEAIPITADTFVEAYSELDGRQSEVVSANCIFDDSLKVPEISCDGTEITLTCPSSGADIYYRLEQQNPYVVYASPITISADTFIEAYSVRDTETSTTVSATCIYNPDHDYTQDYLTFRVITPGVIPWNQINDGGTGTTARSIQYSLNGGSWISITAASATKIDVLAGDVAVLHLVVEDVGHALLVVLEVERLLLSEQEVLRLHGGSECTDCLERSTPQAWNHVDGKGK